MVAPAIVGRDGAGGDGGQGGTQPGAATGCGAHRTLQGPGRFRLELAEEDRPSIDRALAEAGTHSRRSQPDFAGKQRSWEDDHREECGLSSSDGWPERALPDGFRIDLGL